MEWSKFITNFIQNFGQLSSIRDIIIGALASGIIGYFIGLRRENKILRQRIEIETAEKLFEMSKLCSDLLATIGTLAPPDFSMYNSWVVKLHSINKEEEAIINLNNKLISNSVDAINQVIEGTSITVLEACKQLCNLVIYMESHEVVLYGFNNLRNGILESGKNIRENWFDYKARDADMGFSLELSGHNIVSKESIGMTQKAYNQLMRDSIDASCYLMDLNKALQNEYIGKLFKQKVERRIPIDKNCKVLTVEKTKRRI